MPGFFTDDDEFIAEFSDLTWRPITTTPEWKKLLNEEVIGLRQVELANNCMPFLNTIDEQIRQMRRRTEFHPTLHRPYSFLAGILKRSYRHISNAYVSAVGAKASKEETIVLRLFLARCIEAWIRNNWPLKVLLMWIPDYMRPETETIWVEIPKIRGEIQRGVLPPPKKSPPPRPELLPQR